jgi:hypothetical protein
MVPKTTVTSLLASLVSRQSCFCRCLCRMRSTDYLHAAAGSGLSLDDLTFHRRGILSQVERGSSRWRRLTDSFGWFSREGGSSECEDSDRRQENFLHVCLPVVVRPELDKGQIEPAGKGSSDGGFVFVLQPKIAVLLRVRPVVWSTALPCERSHHDINDIHRSTPGTIGPRACWLPDTVNLWRNAMNNLAISLAVGATALFVTAGASAAPLSADVSVVPQQHSTRAHGLQ